MNLYDLASKGTNCHFCTLVVRAARVHPDFREGDGDHISTLLDERSSKEFVTICFLKPHTSCRDFSLGTNTLV